MEIFYILIVVVVAWLKVFTVCKLYLNMPDWEKKSIYEEKEGREGGSKEV